MTTEELIENFELLEDWEDRYRYLIDLGGQLPPLPDNFRTEAWKVQGCQSQVWLVPSKDNGRIYFQGDSDAMIVKGLIAVAFVLFSGRTPSEILATDVEEVFAGLGLSEHLTPSRRNGLIAMTEKIKYYAHIL